MIFLVQLKATVYSLPHPTHTLAHTPNILSTCIPHTESVHSTLHPSCSTCASHDHTCLYPMFVPSHLTYPPTLHPRILHSTHSHPHTPLIVTPPLHRSHPAPYFLTSHAPGVQAYTHVHSYMLDLNMVLT